MLEVSDSEAQAVVSRLADGGCVDAEGEAAVLLAAAPDVATLHEWVARRRQGEPPAWITGSVMFCERPLQLDHGVYVPRVQSEELARRAASVLARGGRALDLCTGSGAVAAHLIAEVPTATVIATDLDVRAVACARRNGVPAIVADLDSPLRRDWHADVVTAVAPYVPTAAISLLPRDVQRHEPHLALDGGDDGLSVVRRVIAASARRLRLGGWLLIEVGADQDRRLAESLADRGFDDIDAWADDDGDLRGIAARFGLDVPTD